MVVSSRNSIQRLRAVMVSNVATPRMQKVQQLAGMGILPKQCGHARVFGPTDSSDLKRSITPG